MSRAWFPFYSGDYLADTGHLSLAQNGAYLLLMAHYYRTEKPIPAEGVYRICRCSDDTDKAVCDSILKEFFVREDDAFRHGRIEKEIAKQQRAYSTATARAKKAADARWKPNPQAIETEPEPKPEPEVKAVEQPRKKAPSDGGMRLAEALKAEILRNKPDAKIPDASLPTWAHCADLMMSRDGRSQERIAALIRWAQSDEFWKSNVLSMDTLRKQFDRLELKAREKFSSSNGHGNRAQEKQNATITAAQRAIEHYS